MLVFAVLFVIVIVALALFLNSVLDRREVKRLGRDEEGRDGPTPARPFSLTPTLLSHILGAHFLLFPRWRRER